METLYNKSPLNIPTGKIGKWEVKHKTIEVGEKLTVVSQRDALFSGKRPRSTIVSTSFRMHQLYEGKSLWMTDSPQEQESQQEVVKKCKGNVLIGGLGLGYIAKMLVNKPDVEFVTVIEKEQAVIDLVWKHLKIENGIVIKANLFDYLASPRIKYDWAYYDIWAPTGEDILYTHIRPLKKLSKGKIPFNHILCWEEDTMIGQMMWGLFSSIQLMDDTKFGILSITDEQFNGYYNTSRTTWTFYNWLRKTKPSKEDALKFARHYCSTYTNYPKWRQIWGYWENEKDKALSL